MGRFHCLFSWIQTLIDFFKYLNQRCLTLYMQEALRLGVHILQCHTRLDSTQQITSSQCYPQGGALRDILISAQLHIPHQCRLVGPPPLPRDFNDITTSDPSPRDGRDPPGLSGELPLLNSNTTDDLGIPLTLPLYIILYSISSIRPWMIGEMGLFHDKPIPLLLSFLHSASDDRRDGSIP
jgi:hypothetical protein